MAQSGQRKCLCCKLFFDPDHRNRERQRYCSQPECRLASKTASQGAWLAQSDNHDYFRGPVHVARVQAWRAAHPGYRSRSTTVNVSITSAVPAGQVIARDHVFGNVSPAAAAMATTMGVVRLPGNPPMQCLSAMGVRPQSIRSPTSTIARVRSIVSWRSIRPPAQALRKAAICMSE